MKTIEEVVDNISQDGFYKTHVSEFLNSYQQTYFNETVNLYRSILNTDHVIENINNCRLGIPMAVKGKAFELNQEHLLRRPISNNDSIFKLYTQQQFIDVAEMYLGAYPKLRNILTWVHPQSNIRGKKSQRWHRDPEGKKILKVFINFSNIIDSSGPTRFCKQTHRTGKLFDSTEDSTGGSYYPSNQEYIVNRYKEGIVDITGGEGTITFIDTSGFHCGGEVEVGNRLLTHACFLNPHESTIPGLCHKTLHVDYSQLSSNMVELF